MKKYPLILLLTLFLAAPLISFAEVKIATVKIAEVYKDYWRREDANAKFQASVKKARENLGKDLKAGQALVEEIKELRKDFDNPAISETDKANLEAKIEKKIKVIQQKELELNQKKTKIDEELQKKHNRILESLFNEIREVAKSVAQKRGANLLLNESDAGVVFADESFDITEEVIDILNTNRP